MDIMDMLENLIERIQFERDWEKQESEKNPGENGEGNKERSYHFRLRVGFNEVFIHLIEAKDALEKCEKIKEERNNDEHY